MCDRRVQDPQEPINWNCTISFCSMWYSYNETYCTFILCKRTVTDSPDSCIICMATHAVSAFAVS